MRLFLAVEIPAEWRRELAARAERARRALPSGARRRARWVAPENYHVTLLFLGEQDPGAVPEIGRRAMLIARATPAMTVRLGAPGAFPSPRRARVLSWTLAADRGLADLEAGLRGALAPWLPATDSPSRGYHPHVTAARCDPPWSPEETRLALGRLAAPAAMAPSDDEEHAAAVAADPDAGADAGTRGGGERGAAFLARDVALFESRLGAGRPRYEALERFPLEDGE